MNMEQYTLCIANLMNLIGLPDLEKCIKCHGVTIKHKDIVTFVKHRLGDEQFEAFKKELQRKMGKVVIPDDDSRSMECVSVREFLEALAATCKVAVCTNGHST